MNTLLILLNLFVLVGIFMLIRINYQFLKDLWDLNMAVNSSQEKMKESQIHVLETLELVLTLLKNERQSMQQ